MGVDFRFEEWNFFSVCYCVSICGGVSDIEGSFGFFFLGRFWLSCVVIYFVIIVFVFIFY